MIKPLMHILTCDDIDRDFLEAVFERADAISQHRHSGCPGIVVGLFLLEESTRTSSILKTSAIHAGGGWIGIESREGTYLAEHKESIKDTMYSIADVSDIVAVRGLENLENCRELPVPVLNALSGDDHVLAAIWRLYSLRKLRPSLKNCRVGIYGMVRFSRVIKSFYRVWSWFGISFVEDSVISETKCPNDLVREITNKGSRWESCPLESFIGEVDLLIIVEGLPSKDAPAEVIKVFNERYKSVNAEMLHRLPCSSGWLYHRPRWLPGTEPRPTVSEDLDSHPQLLIRSVGRESVECNVGLYSVLVQR